MSRGKSASKNNTKFVIRQRRVFSESFKREKVAQISAGEISVTNFCKLWSVSPSAVYNWLHLYSPDHKKGTTMVIQKDSEASINQELRRRIAELEQAVGQKQMVIDYQNRLIENASEEFEVDLKKNFSLKP